MCATSAGGPMEQPDAWLAFTSQSENTTRLLKQSPDGPISEALPPLLHPEHSLCVAEVDTGIVVQV